MPVCLLRGHSHIESSYSLHQIDTSVWMGLAPWLFDVTIWYMKYRFFFLIWRKKCWLEYCKGKPSENPLNIAKNQEFELITSHHFKNLISPNLHFFFFKKKFLRKTSKPGHGNLFANNSLYLLCKCSASLWLWHRECGS